jgi:hypothetical protein
MAKLSKMIRKGAAAAVRSDIAKGVIEKVITAALLAAAARLAETRTARQAKRKVKAAVTPEPARRKAARARNSS